MSNVPRRFETRQMTKLKRRATFGTALIYSSVITFLMGVLLSVGGIMYVAHNNRKWCSVVVELANADPPPSTDRGVSLVEKFKELARDFNCKKPEALPGSTPTQKGSAPANS